MTEEKKHDRVNMNWPLGLKERVSEHVGARGLTEFVVGAVETRLVDEDRVKTLEKEVDELRYLAQLLADRYVMGGDHENRETFLMEVDLPSWIRTEGWPTDLAKQVQKDHIPEVHTPKPPAPVIGQPTKEYTEAELHAPSYAVAARESGKSPMPASPEVLEAAGEQMITPGGSPAGTYTTEAIQTPVEEPEPAAPLGRDNPVYAAPSESFLAKVQAKAAERGIDFAGTDLKPASAIQAPAKPPVHNHSWIRDDQGELHCDCGAFIDESDGPPGIVREAGYVRPTWEVPTEPAPELEVPAEAPTPVVSERSLDDFDVDF